MTWSGADRLVLENKYGRIKIVGSGHNRTRRGGVSDENGLGGQRVGGECVASADLPDASGGKRTLQIGVAAPQDARDRMTVDYEITVPRRMPLEAVTTFGDIAARGHPAH